MADVYSMIPASAKGFWVILILIGAVAVGLVALFGYMGYSSQNTRFEVTRNGLRITGTLYSREIPAHALVVDQVERVNLQTTRDLQPRRRTNGIGMPGYQAGWFRLRNKEKALLFVTDRTRVVRVPTTEGYTLLVSVENPNSFVRALGRLSG